MRKILLTLVLGFLFITGNSAIAGDIYIKGIGFDGRCAKIEFGSTENDTDDRVVIRCKVFNRQRNRETVFGGERLFRNISGSGYFVEFCGRSVNPEYAIVHVQAFHNGKLEDQMTWSRSRR